MNNFEKYSNNWWNKDGEMKMLHKMNDIRFEYIQKIFTQHNISQQDSILDFGCGCGIFSEFLAKNGYKITGYDSLEQNISNATKHNSGKYSDLQYTSKLENLLKYKVIICFEVIEHIENISDFIEQILKFTDKNSIIIFSTINKTAKSLVFAKFLAEYILKIVPIGVHEWKKFVSPCEINKIMEARKYKNVNLQGLKYNPFSKNFSFCNSVDINYFISFTKV